MKIIIYQNREVYKEESKIGNDSENKIETLEFEFPEEYKDFTKYIEFQIKGEKYTDIIEDDKYEITRAIAKQGKIKAQVVLRNSIESDVAVFKSNVFELSVSKSINATETIPEQYPTWIDNLTILKQNLEKTEQERVISENKRVESETQREETFSQMEESVENAVKEIVDKKDDYNRNAVEKVNEYNELAEQKTNIFNSNAETKTNSFNQNASEKTTAFDIDVATKTNEFDTNATNKTNEFNSNSNTKLAQYNNNANEKITEYNNNALSKSEEYNTNASNKVNAYNQNATSKLEEYNENATSKLNEYNQNAESLINRLIETELENTRLREDLNGLPKGQATGESIDLSDSAKMRCDLKISGNSKQETREGYNLFKLEDKTFSTSSVTVLIKDGKITINGTPSSNAINETIFEFTALKSGVYTLLPFKSSDNANIRLIFSVNNGSYNSNDQQSQIELSEGDILKINLRISSTDTITNFSMTPMLYEDIEEKPYEPYGAMPSLDFPSEVESCGDNGCINEVICNKNLFTGWKEGQISSTNGEETTYKSRYRTDFIKIKPNSDYYFRVSKPSTDSAFWFSIYKYDKNKKYIGYERLKGNNPYAYEGIINCDAEYIRITEISALSFLNNTIIEEGETATDYEEHKEQTYTIPVQQPMRSVGDIRDTFIKKNNKWYERHYISRQIFTGNENFIKSTSTANDIFVCPTKFNINLTNVQKSLCNYVTYNQDVNKINKFYFTNDKLIVFVYSPYGTTTLEQFKTWLAEKYNEGTPVYVDYRLVTPLDIECTEEQNKILDQIEKEVKTYKNVTHIYSTDNVSPVIDVTYKKDLETRLNNIEQAILSQGGNI